MACPALEPGAGFISGMLRFVDCEVQAIGSGAYQALAAPGSTFSLVLAGFLTLFVALFGYRMLFGHTPGVREGVLALAKIGLVMALATSWPAFRTVVYDVTLRGPAELAAQVGAPAGLPGASGGMVARLEFADRGLVALSIAGTGQPPSSPGLPQAQLQQRVPPPFAGFEPFALGGSRILFLVGVIGAFAAVRIIAGLMLALAPFFFAFLLFDATRGLFEGWLRVLAGAALGALGASLVLGVELALLEPWLIRLLDARAAGVAIPSVPVELLVVTLVFCLVLLAILYATARLAMGFRLPPAWRSAHDRLVTTLRDESRTPRFVTEHAVAPSEGRSRAAAVVDAVAANQRRETALSVATAASLSRSPSPAPLRDASIPTMAPLGQSFRRRTATRVSASAGRRDRKP